MSVRIDIHADDFGESVHASRDILECLKDGKLNSISVLANMSCFEECVSVSGGTGRISMAAGNFCPCKSDGGQLPVGSEGLTGSGG